MITVVEVLEAARARGFLGPGPVEPHVEHAHRFAVAAPTVPRRALDLGSGGGIPGLVLADRWPDSRWVLVDSHARRTAFLTDAVQQLGWVDRVEVVRARAEVLAHDRAHRGQYHLVTARSFGPPAAVAECGAGFLCLGGHLLVSEPPEPVDRWPAAPLAALGLVPVETGRGGVAILRQAHLCPLSYPRPPGRPTKRPLF